MPGEARSVSALDSVPVFLQGTPMAKSHTNKFVWATRPPH
jgi:hypothetical protein